jgi:hypothetical protein
MPGYLSNRRIAFDPTAEVAALEVDLNTLETTVEAVQGDVEDLQLNIGV